MSDSSSSTSNLDSTKSIEGDIVEGNFVAFSQSNMYWQGSNYGGAFEEDVNQNCITMQGEKCSQIKCHETLARNKEDTHLIFCSHEVVNNSSEHEETVKSINQENLEIYFADKDYYLNSDHIRTHQRIQSFWRDPDIC